MVAIFEQELNKGRGLHFDTFKQRFRAISEELIRNERFQFITMVFYDFRNPDDPLRKILRNDGGKGFGELAELTGEKVVLFYLHSTNDTNPVYEEKYNREFLRRLDIRNVEFPLVVFFTPNREDQRFDTRAYSLSEYEPEVVFHALFTLIKAEKDRQGSVGRSPLAELSGIKVEGLREGRSFAWQKTFEKVFDSIQELFSNLS